MDGGRDAAHAPGRVQAGHQPGQEREADREGEHLRVELHDVRARHQRLHPVVEDGDAAQSLGSTQFRDEITYLRAVEGELSRSIATLRGVQAAKVHIVMAKREPFSREWTPPTASVLLTVTSPDLVGRGEVAAIRHLVASAVARLRLEDISVSRAGQSWGIPLPFDQDSVVYVWFDALINYASAVGLGTDPALFERWWPADLHVIGKDITRFHVVIWPAMLMSAGVALPAQVFGHGFMTVDGQRMSKSLGTVIDPLEAADRLGADPLRLYLTKEIPYGSDGDFTWERFEEKYNVDLANNLGNLVNRVTAMADRYRQGRLRATPVSGRLGDLLRGAPAAYAAAMDRWDIDEGCRIAFRLVDATNEYIAASEPWALAKQDRQKELDEARSRGRRIRLVATGERMAGGGIRLHTAPQPLDPDDPLYSLGPGEKAVVFETTTMGTITVRSTKGGPVPTAACVIKDVLNIGAPIGLFF